MAFLNPIYLYLLPLAILPILIHLLGRRRVKTIKFSSLRFLRELENELMRKIKLRQILLLILRTLLIVVIILILARPYRVIESAGLRIGKGGTLILLVDNSASMQLNHQGYTLFQWGLERAKSLIEGVELPFHLKIYETSLPFEVSKEVFIKSKDQFISELEKLAVANFKAEPVRALDSISSYIVKNRLFNATIWIISDFQSSNWNPIKGWLEQQHAYLQKWNLKLVFIPIEKEKQNFAITGLELGSPMLSVGEPIRLTVNISNWGEDSEDVPINLYLEGERIAQNLVQFKKESWQKGEFEFVVLKTGKLSGFVEIGEDLLESDNRYYFVLNYPEAINVLIVSQSTDESKYLIKALEVSDKNRINVQTTGIKELIAQNFRDYDLIMFLGVDELSSELEPKLEEYLTRGKKIIFFPGVNSSPEKYNEYWFKKWNFPRWHTTTESEGQAYLTFGRYIASHPIFYNLWTKSKETMDPCHFYKIPAFIVRPADRPLIYFSNGMPFMIETEHGIVFATCPMESWTDWQFFGSFPIIILRTLQYLTTQLKSSVYETGDTFQFNLPRSGVGETVLVQSPSGRKFRLEFDETKRSYFFKDINEVGVFNVLVNGRFVDKFVANLPAEECAPEFWGKEDFDQLKSIDSRQINYLLTHDLEGKGLFSFTQELEGLLLILAVLLAFSETFIGLFSKGRQS